MPKIREIRELGQGKSVYLKVFQAPREGQGKAKPLKSQILSTRIPGKLEFLGPILPLGSPRLEE